MERTYGKCVGTMIRLNDGKVVPSLIFKGDSGLFSFHCTKCKYITFSKKKYKTHARTHEIASRTCSKCNFRTAIPFEAKIHHRMHYTDKSQFFCHDCDFVTDVRDAIERHVKVHVYASEGTLESIVEYYLKSTRSSDGFPCPFCSLGFQTAEDCRSHVQSHVEAQLYVCSVCSYSASSRASLSVHMRIHNDTSNKLQCPHCLFSTEEQRVLKLHIAEHV